MTPEQKARVSIDALLTQAGWHAIADDLAPLLRDVRALLESLG